MNDFVEVPPDLVFLVVDESPTFRELLSHTLKKLGFKEVYHAIDGLSALATLRRMPIGFIICDRNMQKMSGMELLKEIRESPELRRVPFVMMAQEIPKDDVMLASEFGIDGYLKKPFVMKDVSTRVTSAMMRFGDPANPEGLFDSAREDYMRGNLASSIETFEQLKIMLPTSARVSAGLARCFRSQNDDVQAEKYLLEAISLNSLYVHAYHELGCLYIQQEKVELALKYFANAIELSPSNPVRYESVADILMRKARFKEAEEYLEKAVRLELVYPILYEQLGKALFSQKKIQRAYYLFEKALKEQPDNPSFLNSMGICLKEMSRHADALTYYNLALKKRPQDVKILFNKVLCLIHLKDFVRAEKTCLLIIKIDPAYEKAKSKLAEINKLRGPLPKGAVPSDAA